MNTAKFLWILVGVLAIALIVIISYVLGNVNNNVTTEPQLIQNSVPQVTDSELEKVQEATPTSKNNVTNQEEAMTSRKSLLDQVTKGQFMFTYEGEKIPLQNGQYIRYTDPKLSLQFLSSYQGPRYAEGDMNSDGKKDLAISYHASRGGSGGYAYVALFADKNGVATYVDSISLGDSTSIDSISINKGIISVMYTTFPDNTTRSTSYRVSSNKIQEITSMNTALKPVTDWKKEWQKYLPNANFLEMKDITGDGVPELLVNSFAGQGGSGTNVFNVQIFTIKNNNAVEIPVYENGVKRELSQFSGNATASRVYFSDTGVVEENRRGTPGVYENLVRRTQFIYNADKKYLELNRE